jgi:hypothetical protein
MRLATALTILLASAFALSAACGGGGEDDTGGDARSPTATPVRDSGAESIGEYEDENEFVAFAEELDVAITGGDAQFFFENTRYKDVECGVEFPAPPASCEGEPAGSTVQGIIVGVFQSEGFALDQAAYGEFIREFLTEFDADIPDDDYGGPEPRLYAYGDFTPELVEAPVERSVESVHGIATRVAASNRTIPGEGRTVLYIGLNFIDSKWQITHFHIGPAAYLDPFSPEAPEVGADAFFAFWRRWDGQ